MIKNVFVKIGLPLVLFILAGGVTLLAIQSWKGASQPSGQPKETLQTKAFGSQPGTLEGVRGLAESEVVALPELPSLVGGTVSLGNLKEDHLLVCFVSVTCGGCAKDANFWRALKDEAAKRNVAFYLINAGENQAEAGSFVEAHGLEGLPVLYDPDFKAAHGFKVGFAPQYVLLTAKGQVIARWDGVRYYEGQPKKLAQMFDRISD